MSEPIDVRGHNNPKYAPSPLLGPATLHLDAGRLRLEGQRDRPVIPVVVGVITGGIALFGVIFASLALAHVGLDLTRVRRGTTLIAVFALMAGVGGFGVGGVLVDKLLGKAKHTVEVPRDSIQAVQAEEDRVLVLYRATPSAQKPTLVVLFPEDRQGPALAARLQG